jgi:hypothetical protein
MRPLLIFTGGAAALTSSLLHRDVGRLLITDSELTRVILPPISVQVVTVWLIFILSYLVHRRGLRWLPPLLVAWCLWAFGGRVVAADVTTGEITGHWYMLPVDHHSLRPANVDPHRYMCDARVRPRGWWLDLEYAGTTDAVYLGPFIAQQAADELGRLMSSCRDGLVAPPASP